MGSGAHPGGSRLSKLLRLIEDGSSLETRKAAGEQIAGIVAAHPAQLPSVIRQVSIFLRQKDWDARTAAGHCLGAIAQRVQHHTPASIAQAAGVDRTHLTPQRAEAAEEAAAPAATLSDAQPPMGAVSAGGVRHVYDETSQTMAGPESSPPLLSLASFNVSQVLEQGVQLLASGGDEYVEHEAADLSQQRANLKKRLGLGTGTDAFLDTADIFGDEDLVNNGAVAGAASAVTKASDEAPQMKTMQDSNQLTAATDILADMAGGSSARERAAAVRKAKAAKRRAGTLPTAIGSEQPASKRAKSDDKGSTRPSVDAEDHGNTVQMIDADVVEKEWQEIESGHWPFQALCNQLSVDVLHPTWEVRHGAALGLRDILTSQAAAAAVVAPLADPPGGCWLAAGGTGRPELSHVSAADAVQAASANARWLEDCCVHLLCALALDRFDDFLSDQVVAPVRETAAQALGAAARPLSSAAIVDLVNCLRALVEGVHWQPRHGGLQGLKYVLAAREVDASLLAGALPATIAGLKDADDDVRAVAAEALLPAAALLARDGSPEGLHARGLVWDALLGDDELSPAVKGATMLLAALHSSTILDAGRFSDESTNTGAGLPELVPRLWPHLGHNLSSVRRATLQCLFALLKAHSVAVLLPEVEELRRAGRLLFQRILLETDDAVLEEALNTWEVLVRRASGTELAAAFTTAVLTSLFALASTPPHTKLPMKHVIAAQRDSNMHAHGCDPQSSISNTNDMTMGDAERAARRRLFASKALGQLACALENRCQMGQPNHSVDIILDCLKSTSASARVLGGYTCVHWARLALPERFHSSGNASSASSSAMPANLKRVVDAALEQLGAPPPQYQELASLYLQVQARATALLQLTQGRGEQLTLPQGATSASLGADAALSLAAQVPANASKEMLASARALQAAATTLQTPEAVLRTSASAALAGAVVVHGAALPAKLNVLIQPLIAAVRREPHAALQSQAAESLARLALLVTSRSPSPTDKILKNVCGFACGDPVAIPSAVQPPSLDDGVLETKANGTTANGVKSTSNSQAAKGAIAAAAAPTSITSTAEPPSAFALTRRGGEAMLRALALHAGTNLLQLLPTFWSHHVRAPIEAIARAHQQAGTASIDALQAAIHALRVLEVIAPVMHPDAVLCAIQLLPLLSTCLCQVNAAVQLAASRTLSSLAAAQPIIVMPPALGVITPLLAADKPDAARLGGVLALRESVRALGLRMVPYVQLAIIPLLGRMSDSVSLTRTVASRCFADVVSLVPLAHGIARPSGLSPEQEASLEREGGFLTRLLDNSQVEDVQLPFKLKGGASLRRYQQEGVNWLAFLRRFGLHGVLADDMGLGKTLQATAILAIATADARASTSCPCPSLIICPSTLVAHWPHEIAKFVDPDVLCPLQYHGAPAERATLRSMVHQHDVVVMSYETLRADVEWIASIKWTYCVLDEGHAIRNPASKIAQAARKVDAQHRLILSGTPIQNSVLELWALFDFLMPGFLGTDRAFNARYGKALAASRGAATGNRGAAARAEAEAGVLALDALHRQVMPFVLRRTKDQVLADLPPKTVQDVICDPGALQRVLYEDFAASQAMAAVTGVVQEGSLVASGKKDSTAVGNGGGGAAPPHVFQALHYLRRLCSHPLLVLDPKLPAHVKAVNSVLGHVSDWSAAEARLRSDLSHAPKLAALRELLLDAGIGTEQDANSIPGESEDADAGHRALVFAQTRALLDLAESTVLQPLGVSWLRIDGGVDATERFRRVQRFNADPTIGVMLLTTAVGGLGLNLTAADTVIFLEHDWNPQKDLQAMDRAHRLGQRRAVNVYRLLVRGTLEEQIMSLQRFKLDVAAAVVNAENMSLSAMDTGNLLDLFALQEEEKGKGGAVGEKAAGSGTGGGGAPSKGGLAAVLAEITDPEKVEAQYGEEFDLEEFKRRLGK